MGHAGAIISGGKGTAKEKMDAMRAAGIFVVDSPAMMGETMKKALAKKYKATSTVKTRKKSKSKKKVRTVKAAKKKKSSITKKKR
jgi:succinyl-CoA synthetase alpha subunit